MIGYVYKTTNLINGRIYIGKHSKSYYDLTYYGSGKILKKAIKKYGKNNFSNELLCEANSDDELNLLEKKLISEYKAKYGDLLYNIAEGGTGGDTISGLPDDDRQKFVDKMTIINRKRCSSEDFKNKISKANKIRYSDENVRKKHALKIKATWADPELRKRHGQYIHDYFQQNKKDMSYLYKPCRLEHNGIIKDFDSVKSLKMYLKDQYDIIPNQLTIKRLFKLGEQRIEYKPFHKNKDSALSGIMIYYIDKSVETKPDECKVVENEISTFSKCET